jgi:DNA-binding beta-propeller fold protein YncE
VRLMLLGLLLALHSPPAPVPSCQPGHRPISAGPLAPIGSAPRAAFALHTVADVRLPGGVARFGSMSLDLTNDRLYLAHRDAGTIVILSLHDRRVVSEIEGVPKVSGLLALPDLGRLYASSTSKGQLVMIDLKSLAASARASGLDSPDGVAYAPNMRRLFVSDEQGKDEAVIDMFADTLVSKIPLGGEAGNTVYDPVSACILVAVQETGELAVIDPESSTVVMRIAVTGIEKPRGVALDVRRRLAFVAGAGNNRMAIVDLATGAVNGSYELGDSPDGVAVDEEWGRVYVGSESGTVSTYTEIQVGKQTLLVHDGDFFLPAAHAIAVDPRTHELYLPLEEMNGHPVLRIMSASAPR